MLSSAFVFMFVLFLSYILTCFFILFDSGQQPAHPMNGDTHFQFMNVFRLTLDHVLF